MRYVALLRGINLGSRNRVKMVDLRALLERLGYRDVHTLLQSGNVVLTSRKAPTTVGRELERHIAADLGVESPVVVRTRDELADVISRDPLGDVVDDPKRYQVSFLSGKPDPDTEDRLEAVRLPAERFAVSGHEIYAWHPAGIRDSKLSNLLGGKRLGVTATARNWNTATKLLALADAAGAASSRVSNPRR